MLDTELNFAAHPNSASSAKQLSLHCFTISGEVTRLLQNLAGACGVKQMLPSSVWWPCGGAAVGRKLSQPWWLYFLRNEMIVCR